MAVTRQWSQDSYQLGQSAEQVYWIDASDENQATFASGLPKQNQSHPRDSRLLAQVPIVRPLMIGTLYEARVSFVRLRSGSQEQDDLLKTAPTLHWVIGTTSEAVDTSADGWPLLNSVGDMIEGVTRSYPTLFLEYTRYESAYDVQKALAYGNKTNSDNFSINGPHGPMMVEPGQALCQSIATERYAVDAEAVPVTYSFEFREDGFDHRILDQGYNGLWDDNGTKKVGAFIDGNGDRMVKPVRLKNGKPIQFARDGEIFVSGGGSAKKTPVAGEKPGGAFVEGIEEADWLFYKRHKEIPFAGLNL